jgi:hypothetical protein
MIELISRTERAHLGSAERSIRGEARADVDLSSLVVLVARDLHLVRAASDGEVVSRTDIVSKNKHPYEKSSVPT